MPRLSEILPESDEKGALHLSDVAPTQPDQKSLRLSDISGGRTPSVLEVSGLHAARSVPGALGALAGAGRGALLGSKLGLPGSIVGGLAGGFAGGVGTEKLLELAGKTFVPEQFQKLEQTLSTQSKQRPFAAATGSVLPLLAGFRPGIPRLPMGAIGAGLGAASEVAPALVQGRDIDPAQVILRTVSGAFLQKPTSFGRKLGFAAPPESTKLEETPISPRVQRITEAIKAAKPLRAEQEALVTRERGKRLAELLETREKIGGEAGFKAELGALKGQLPKVRFEPIRSQFDQSDIDGLFNDVNSSPVLGTWEPIEAKSGLLKLFEGSVPTNSELDLLRKVFGRQFAEAALSKRTFFQKANALGLEGLNLPRAIMASYDLSAPFRQGIFLVGRPKQWVPAFGNMFKQFVSPRAFEEAQLGIVKRPTYPIMQEAKLSLTELGGEFSKREEQFMSQLGGRIPILGVGVRASNRAYTGFLNKLRADVFDDLYKKGQALGVSDDPRFLKSLGTYINAATGRGPLRIPGVGGLSGSELLEKSSVALNTILFSPRLLASRLSLIDPTFYTRLHPFVRKQAIRDLMTFASTGATVLGMLKLNGMQVSSDPRNSDFGKGRIGNTRFDIWGGFQQPIVAATRLLTNQMISSTTGREFTLGDGFRATTRKDILQRFLESKQAPVISLMNSMLTGKTISGQPVRLSSEIVNRFVPMFLGDLFEVTREHGVSKGWMAIPGAFGVGIQSYGDFIPLLESTASGRKTVRFRDQPDVGESLVNLLTGNKVSNIPEQFHPGLEQAKQLQLKKQLGLDQAKRMVLETGRPIRVGNTIVYLDRGIVKTKTFGTNLTPEKVLVEQIRSRK